MVWKRNGLNLPERKNRRKNRDLYQTHIALRTLSTKYELIRIYETLINSYIGTDSLS